MRTDDVLAKAVHSIVNIAQQLVQIDPASEGYRLYVKT
jgi:hypothetical protein